MRFIHREAFQVVGVSGRTTNAREASAQGIIGGLWQLLMTRGILAQIPEKVGSNILAVYSDYESDENGEYTYTLGAHVRQLPTTLPKHLTALTVPAGIYAVFTSARGPVQTVVVDTWKRIWNIRHDHPELHRTYQADFEIYYERAGDREHAEVEICVGVAFIDPTH